MTDSTTLENVGEPALRAIMETAVRAAGATDKVRVLDIKGCPPGVVFVHDTEGTIEPLSLPRPPREHSISTVGEVAPYIEHLQKMDGLADDGDDEGSQPVVWYSEDRVVIVLDDRHNSQRRDLVTCPLKHSDAWKLLRECEQGKAWTQKDFIRVLRTKLWDCLGEQGDAFLRALRTLSRQASDKARSDHQHGRATIDREIEDQLKSESGDLPEVLALQVRVYQDPALELRQTVQCALDIDPQLVQFSLIPLAGQLDDAQSREMAILGQLLDDADADVFYGRP